MEYEKHIEFYSLYWYQHFSTFFPENEWGNKELAEKYLRKYWLTEDEYQSTWKPIQDKIFVQGESLPNLIFTPELEIIAIRGGCLFAKEDFEQLQKAIQETGETQLVVIQNTQDLIENEPVFKMKFPANITWKELTSGNYISAVLIEMIRNEYFVFGVNGKWGKYSASDYENPLDIIGFKSEYKSIFENHFKLSNEEQDEITEWLPPKYKEFINK